MNEPLFKKKKMKEGLNIMSFFLEDDRTDSCPDEEILAAFMDGELNEQEETELRSHLKKCSSCSYTVLSLESQGVKIKKKKRSIRLYFLQPVPVLATLLLAFIIGFFLISKSSLILKKVERFRHINMKKLELIGPVGEIKEFPLTFKWIKISGAKNYHFVLLDEEFNLIWENSHMLNNSTSLPQEISDLLTVNKTYFWKVTAFLEKGQKLDSPTQYFSLK